MGAKEVNNGVNTMSAGELQKAADISGMEVGGLPASPKEASKWLALKTEKLGKLKTGDLTLDAKENIASKVRKEAGITDNFTKAGKEGIMQALSGNKNTLVEKSESNIDAVKTVENEGTTNVISEMQEAKDYKILLEKEIKEVAQSQKVDARLLSQMSQISLNYDNLTEGSSKEEILIITSQEKIHQTLVEYSKQVDVFSEGEKIPVIEDGQIKMDISGNVIFQDAFKDGKFQGDVTHPLAATLFGRILQWIFGKNNLGDGDELSGYESNNRMSRSLELGALSEKYESGGRGPEAYNPDDVGKPAYGTYQLRADAFNTFCKENKIEPANIIEWRKKVKELGKKDFQKLEYEFIKKTHFDVQVNKIKQTGLDISKFSKALQNVVWSTAVQHGPNTSIIIQAIDESDFSKTGDIGNEQDFIEGIYAIRAAANPSTEKRYHNEEKMAIMMLSSSFQGEYNDIDTSGVQSEGAERSKSGTTLCSRTAYKNLQKYGINSTLDNANVAFEKEIGKEKQNIGVDYLEKSGGKIADIYLDASPRNKRFGHRAVGIKISGEWFVLDPYYPIVNGMKTTSPIPADKYFSYFQNKGRKFWGAKIY